MKVICFNKKIFAVVMSMFLTLTFCSFPAFAADSVTDENSTDYIHFTQHGERMSANGHFTFEFRFAVTSDRFVANSTSISVNTQARIFNASNGSEYADGSKEFSVTLWHDGFIDTVAGSYVGYADNVYGGVTYGNIKKGDTYYLIIAPTDPNFSTGALSFVGSGDVSPVTVK